MFDLLIRGGKVVDGTGSPAFYADVAVKDGKIVRVGKNLGNEATRVIDATGLVITPGFIDSHCHSDVNIFTFPDQREKIEQGITTAVGGQCGSTVAPLSLNADPSELPYVEGVGKLADVYKTMGTFLEAGKKYPQGSNQMTFVGHGALRRAVMGRKYADPTPEEMEKMEALLRDGMEHGAVGLSLGLIYAPSCYSKPAELIALAKVVASYGGVLSAHIRNEGDKLAEAVAEFISIVKASGVRGVVSHHKAAEHAENWGKVVHTLRMIEQANAEGCDIWCDVYPYTASHTELCAYFLPSEIMSYGYDRIIEMLEDPVERAKLAKWDTELWGEDLSWVQITLCPNKAYCGKRISELAAERGKSHYDTLFDILAETRLEISACYFTMCEEDVETVIRYPRAMICTDSGVARNNPVFHPRLKGTFPRVLGRYVRERGTVSLPEMIRKITAMPAAVYGLPYKGLVRAGMDADLCVFDPDKIIDRATYENCNQRAEGLNYVILNGGVVVEDSVYTGERRGRVLGRYEY